jgi:hypothetical protein
MNRVTLVIFTLALSVSLGLAKDTQSSTGESNSGAGNFSLRTLRGCLSQSGNEYELTVGGAAPHQFRLVGVNLTQLDGKVGHMVSITGTMPESSPSGNTNANQANDTINFLSVDDLGTSCATTSDLGPAKETQFATVAATGQDEEAMHSLNSSASFFPTVDPESHPGTYLVVPLVGVIALGLLQVARYWRRK